LIEIGPITSSATGFERIEKKVFIASDVTERLAETAGESNRYVRPAHRDMARLSLLFDTTTARSNLSGYISALDTYLAEEWIYELKDSH
jgi:hypothetical protein